MVVYYLVQTNLLFHITYHIEEMTRTDEEDVDLSLLPKKCNSVITFDDMTLVNQINKTRDIKTIDDLANRLVKSVVNASKDFGEARIVFDKYQEHSLKTL